VPLQHRIYGGASRTRLKHISLFGYAAAWHRLTMVDSYSTSGVHVLAVYPRS